VDDGKRLSLRAKFRKVKGVLVSDRASVFLYWPMFRRQICWSHLLRTFTDFSERDGPAGQIGKELIDYCELVFHYWREHRAGQLADADYKRWISSVQENMKPCLQRATKANLKYVSGSCENLLAHWDAMWTFVENAAVDPTNNHAERELRRLVLWRKRSFGSQSERGDRFVERILTVTQTMRKKAGDTLGFLQQSFRAHIARAPAPSLLAC
jgi:transposase